MLIPTPVENLHEAHAALHEPPRHQRRARKRATRARFLAVEFVGRRRLARHIRQLGHTRLHAERQLVLLGARLDLGVADLFVAAAIEFTQTVEHFAAQLARDARCVIEIKHRLTLRAEGNARVPALEITAAPQPRRNRLHVGERAGVFRVQHDERGQILVERAEPVGEPGAHRGFAVLHRARVDELVGRLVIDRVGLHRPDEAEVVGHLRDVRQELAEPHATLPVLRELERRRREGKRRLVRRHPSESLTLPGQPAFEILSKAALQRGLVVEEVELRRCADERNVDRPFRLGRDFPRLRHRGSERRGGRASRRGAGAEGPLAEQRGERRNTEAAARLAKKLPARERRIVGVKGVLPIGRKRVHGGYLVRDSSRFITWLATSVQAASSGAGIFSRTGESPMAKSCFAAAGSRR